MVSQLSSFEFNDDGGDQRLTPFPRRWAEQRAPLTNGQVVELKHAIDQMTTAIADLQQDLKTNRERLTAVEKVIDEDDITLEQHDDRLDAIEQRLGVDLPAPPLLPAAPPVPDTRMFANHGEVRELPSMEALAEVHEASTALARLYRKALNVSDFETATALFRVGWEQSDEPEVSLETAWGWLQSRGKQLD
jgi:hypothetical protein